MQQTARETSCLDEGWLFYPGDIEAPISNRHIAAYMANKAGWSRGAAKPSYDDSDWRSVNLPHDWSIEGSFDPAHHVSNGYLPRGIGWYRRHFTLDESDRNRSLTLRFDGVSSYCTVYVNGHLMHRNWCGYTSFNIDISDIATFGQQHNTIAVRVDATQPEGWWYEGAGIYRHVWLTKSSLIHVAPLGTFVQSRIASGIGQLEIETCVENSSNETCSVQVISTICDPTGQEVASSSTAASPHSLAPSRTEMQSTARAQANETRSSNSIIARSTRQFIQHVEIHSPQLWDLENPNLYRLITTITQNGVVVDICETTFGIRDIRFDANHGFFLNDKPLRLKGTCNHQDHGGLGVALPDSIHEFRIARLKAMGCNAYRCAHNPPAPELLDACDRLGMLVMNENRNFGSTPEHFRQLCDLVKRDRNHPSVILWSICNEESIQGTSVSKSITQSMLHEVKRLDPTRPVTASISGGILNDGAMAEAVEVMGINYQLPLHDQYHAKHPTIPVVAGETHCLFSTRGQYETRGHYFDSYDSQAATWGSTARETWRFVAPREHIAGIFIWTGFDYRGEPTPHEWPSINSHWGLLDLCGFPKDGFYQHKAWWTNEPMVHILPHWNWPGRQGQSVRVMVHSNCDEVELELNGRSLGRKPAGQIDSPEWQVTYEPGTLRAVGYRNRVAVAEAICVTTGPAVTIGLEIPPESKNALLADGHDALAVTVFALDAQGRRVPDAAAPIAFSIQGPGKIISVCNGDPTCQELPKRSKISLFAGLAQVIVQSTSQPGEITLTAASDGLQPAQISVRTIQTDLSKRLPPSPRKYFVTGWRRSPIFADRPDASQEISDQDMNSWERIELNAQSGVTSTGYVLYRATINPPKSIQKTGGWLVMHASQGTPEAYLNNAKTEVQRDGPVQRIALAPNSTSVKLTLMYRCDNSPAGLCGAVQIVDPGLT